MRIAYITAGAAGKMGRSGQAADKGDAERSGEQADQAQKDLDDAQQQLAERRKKAEADLIAVVQEAELALASFVGLDDLTQLEPLAGRVLHPRGGRGVLEVLAVAYDPFDRDELVGAPAGRLPVRA